MLQAVNVQVQPGIIHFTEGNFPVAAENLSACRHRGGHLAKDGFGTAECAIGRQPVGTRCGVRGADSSTRRSVCRSFIMCFRIQRTA